MVLQGEVESLLQAPAPNNDDGSDEQQRLLRGVGGLHHGRSFTLSRARLIGRGNDADIAIDDPAFAEQHARVEVHGERVLLRDLGSADGTRVNGVAVRHCWLQAGDQVVRWPAPFRAGSAARPAAAVAAGRGRRQPRGRAGASDAGCATQGPALAVAAGQRCCWPHCSACCSGSARADLNPEGQLWWVPTWSARSPVAITPDGVRRPGSAATGAMLAADGFQ